MIGGRAGEAAAGEAATRGGSGIATVFAPSFIILAEEAAAGEAAIRGGSGIATVFAASF